MTIRTLFALTLLFASVPALATHPCTSPLILDLNGDGVQLYGVSSGVTFDVNGDGELDTVSWTNPYTEEAFLWLDLNHNHLVDSGRELFGNATLLATGVPAANGFEALAVFDEPTWGGNGDGTITDEDLIWPHLNLWVDSNHDGVSQPQEIGPLVRWKVAALSLQYIEQDRVDGTGSWHRYKGEYVQQVRRLGMELFQVQTLEDVFFAFQVESGTHEEAAP